MSEFAAIESRVVARTGGAGCFLIATCPKAFVILPAGLRRLSTDVVAAVSSLVSEDRGRPTSNWLLSFASFRVFSNMFVLNSDS